MIVYWILLLLIAFLGYFTGSVSTLRVASRFVFKRNLRRLGTDSVFLSNFRRLYGWWGAVRLLLTEVLKDLLPILFGSLLLSLKGHAAVGAAFGAFCMMLGRLWPVFNRFRGCHGCIALILCGLLIEPSVGVTAAAGVIAGIWIFKTLSMGAVVGALAMVAVAVMVVEKQLILILTALICLLVLLHHIPAMRRMLRGTEEKLSRKEDISYKFDEKF